MANVIVGSLPGQLVLKGWRGDKWGPFQFTAQTTLDLSGRTWLAQIRADRDRTGDVVATLTVDATEAAAGKINLTLPPDQSALLATGTTGGKATPGKGTYYFDVQATLTSDATDVKTWFAGEITVLGDVSVPA